MSPLITHTRQARSPTLRPTFSIDGLVVLFYDDQTATISNNLAGQCRTIRDVPLLDLARMQHRGVTRGDREKGSCKPIVIGRNETPGSAPGVVHIGLGLV
jgi:hypothetical protein